MIGLSLAMYFTIAIGRPPFPSLPFTFTAAALPSGVLAPPHHSALRRTGVRALRFRIDPHAETRNAVEKALQRIVREARAAPSGSTVYLENIPNWLPFVDNRFLPGRAALFMLAHDEDDIEGRRVRFVEHHPELLSTYTARPQSRLGRLLVSPDAVAGRP